MNFNKNENNDLEPKIGATQAESLQERTLKKPPTKIESCMWPLIIGFVMGVVEALAGQTGNAKYALNTVLFLIVFWLIRVKKHTVLQTTMLLVAFMAAGPLLLRML